MWAHSDHSICIIADTHFSRLPQIVQAGKLVILVGLSTVDHIPAQSADHLLCLRTPSLTVQADKLASLGGLGQEKSAKTREEATKLMNELVKNVSDVMAGAKTALDAMRTRYNIGCLCCHQV